MILPDYLDSNDVASLNEEFETMLQLHKGGGGPFNTDAYGNLMNVRILKDQLERSAFPTIMDTFSNTFMSDVAAAFFGEDAFRLNGEIFMGELSEGPDRLDTPPFALHFDKRQVLKFFIYLTDTNGENGAMRASPGSNKINREMRQQAMKTNRLNDINNVLSDNDVPSLPVVGTAGTMFVFDTDMAHGASRVQPGKVRRTIRGHTHSLEMLESMRRDAQKSKPA